MLLPYEREKIANMIRDLRSVNGVGNLNIQIERESKETIVIKHSQLFGSVKVEKRMNNGQWLIETARYDNVEEFEGK